MIESTKLLEIFKKNNLTYFTGVPDSTFKGFINHLYSAEGITHRVASNECEAIFLAGGYHVSTGNHGVVYMQNAGLGKTINPITSYASPQIYKIPMLILVGWRGEPGEKDEPQHWHMGQISLRLLDLLQVPYDLLPDDLESAEKVINYAAKYMMENNSPYAIVIHKRNTIEGPKIPEASMNSFLEGGKTSSITREEVIKAVVNKCSSNDMIISTTGKTSRELFEFREAQKQGHGKDFLNVGGMGGASAQAMEIALQHPDRTVYCLDGDGAALMQLGTMVTIGTYAPKNLIHIIFDNECYQSTGNQPSNSKTTHFGGVAMVSGYRNSKSCYSFEQVWDALEEFKKSEYGPSLIVVHCNKSNRKDLGRPTTTPLQNKEEFMDNLGVR